MFTRREVLAILSAAGALAALPSCDAAAPAVGAAAPPAPNPLDTAKKPDRFATLARHNPHIQSVALDAVLSVGNGNFAFNVDCTGLQSLPAAYSMIPLATLSHWAWHSMPTTLKPSDLTYKQYPFHGRSVPYATSSTGQTALYNYLRENPHRLNLARIGLRLEGKEISPAQLANIDQTLDLATGIITSRFDLAGTKVEVTTCCHPDTDGIAVRIASTLLSTGKLTLQIAFAYGSTRFDGDGGDWSAASLSLHQTTSFSDPRAPKQITLNRTVDATRYGVRIDLSQAAGPLKELSPHVYQLAAPEGKDALETSIAFDPLPSNSTPLYAFAEARAASERSWRDYWSTGAAIDLSDCTDPRAPELERRIVLSQYLTAIHCSGQYPSQESGLLCNSWYGKFHLEMHWWHSVHFSYWNRQKNFSRSMLLYTKLLDSARARAARQGFKGARWPKMIGPDGEDSPSPIGPLLIWQQPHPIYYAELCYRADPTTDTLQRWRDIVLETANFLASYAFLDTTRAGGAGGGKYILGPCLRTVSENNDDATINPTYELTAWRFGLATAQKWLERMGQPRNPDWDKVLQNLAEPAVKDGLYMMQEGQDTFTPQWAYEHPALLGALGVLPGDRLGVGGTGGIDPKIMAATVRAVRQKWDFARIWGWDYPTAAMCAARTFQPDLAIDFLTMEAPTNRYLANGANFQRAGANAVPAYFPGNGGLLAAIALMAGGWDPPAPLTPAQPLSPAPGFPKNGQWNVRAEGFRHFI